MLAIIDPTTGEPFNIGYWVVSSFFAAVMGFVSAHMTNFFYDNGRPYTGERDKAGEKKAAYKAAWGTAVLYVVLWIMFKRSGPSD